MDPCHSERKLFLDKYSGLAQLTFSSTCVFLEKKLRYDFDYPFFVGFDFIGHAMVIGPKFNTSYWEMI